ncbi:MAG: UDP-N-acetylglucosamine 1-carboxyvinyltransferase [Patescibacteria group bacterium]
MAKFIIEGQQKLSGGIEVLGAKNAAMKMIAASILIKDKVILENVPNILDIQVIIDILKQNGAEITREGHTLNIDTTNLIDTDPNPELVAKMRGSIVLVGPYLARFKHIRFPKPGGCAIGTRSIDAHLKAFEDIGAKVSCTNKLFKVDLEENLGGVVNLTEPSVTATENIIMSQVLNDKETVINNAATEPQIADLINFLNSAGAKITGAGTRTIEIKPVDNLVGVKYRSMPDPFETATFICMAIVTKSLLKITNCRPSDMYPFLDMVNKIGVDFKIGSDYIQITKINNLEPIDLETGIHPGFSTDMQAPMGLVLTQANGQSSIYEKLFENRLGYLKELVRMGAKVDFVDNHHAVIYGPTKLYGQRIESLDLRAGATLLIAGLIASGTTEIKNAENIDRGYERIESRLEKIGAKIKRIQ